MHGYQDLLETPSEKESYSDYKTQITDVLYLYKYTINVCTQNFLLRVDTK